MAWGEPDSDAVQPPSAHGSGGSAPSQAAGRYGKQTANLLLLWIHLGTKPLEITLSTLKLGENHCSRSPCTHICLLSAAGPAYYSCACPSGWTLAADQITCTRGLHPAKSRETLITWLAKKEVRPDVFEKFIY